MGQQRRTLGVVGLGTVAEPHIGAYLQLDCVAITGVAEPCAQRRNEVSGRFGLPSFESCAQLLAAVRPDIICVLTPASTHREILEESARAGAHVLCEKPMAHTLEDAFAMEHVCRQHAARFCYGSSYRHLPALMQARRLIAEGAIGSVRLLVEEVITGEGESSFQPLSATHYPIGGPGGGGYGLVDHGIHMLDILPGSKGSLRIYHYANRLLLSRDDGVRDCELPRGATPAHFGVQMRHFCQELDDHADPSCGTEVGLRTLTALFAVYESEKFGTWQVISRPPRG